MWTRGIAACLAIGLICSCGQPEDPAPSRTPPPKTALSKSSSSADTTRVGLNLTGSQQAGPRQAEPRQAGPMQAEVQQTLSPAFVSPLYLRQWSKARNRERCAPLAPRSLGDYENARARPAFFSDGWGIAYDLPNKRSAFGVAGTGVSANGIDRGVWLRERRWPDGRVALYGPEGGTGPTLLAYLTVPGQACLYNVWSNISLDHLDLLLDQLRLIDTGSRP